MSDWQGTTVGRPDLGDRSGVFFAAAEMTRMPMLVTDPRLPDNPIVFANRAFLDLTGYTFDDMQILPCIPFFPRLLHGFMV